MLNIDLPAGTEIGKVENVDGLILRQSGKCEYANYDSLTNVIRTSEIIDREQLTTPDASFELLLVAQPAAVITVHVNVLDINDNSPQFQPDFMVLF